MKLNEMHSFINQALTDKAIAVLSEYRTIENSNQPPPLKDVARKKTVASLRNIIDYLEGEFGILPMDSINRAKELEEKEPQFIAVAEHNQQLTKEIYILKERWTKLVNAGVVDDKTGRATKTSKKTKKKVAKKAAPKKKKAAPKKKATKKKAGPTKKLQCPKCKMVFKNGAGLARHVKSCKGKKA